MDANCGKCGASLTAAEILYDEHGAVMCETCLLAEQARQSQQQASPREKAIAYSGPAVGLAAFFWNPWWLSSAAAIGTGLYVFRSLRDTGNAVRLSHAAEKMKVAAMAGMALGGLAAVVQLLRMVGKLAG